MAFGLEEDRDRERHAHEEQPLEVLGAQPEIRGAVAEQVGGQQRFLSSALPGTDVKEEAGQERDPDCQGDDQQRVVVAGLQDPEQDEEHADRGEDRAERIKRALRIRRHRIDDPTGEDDDRADDYGLEDERGLPTDALGDRTSDQRSRRRADAPIPLMTPKAFARDSGEVNAIVVRM